MNSRQINFDDLRKRAESAILESREELQNLESYFEDNQLQEEHRSWPERVGRLLEELHIYHTELEIQNQELLSARSQVELGYLKYRGLFDNLPLPGVLVDGRGFVSEVNEQARLLFPSHFGQTLLNRSAAQLFSSSSRYKLHQLLREHTSQGPSLAEMLQLNNSLGSGLTVNVHAIRFRDENSRDEVNLLLLVDMSTEIALRESENRFRLMADGAPVLIWVTNRDRLTPWFNRPWREFTGHSIEQDAGQGWLEAVHPDDREFCMGAYGKAFEAHEAFSLEHRLQRRDGAYRWLLNTGLPRHDDQGVFQGFIGSLVDITERKQAESQLQLAASVFQSAHEGIMIIDTDARLLDVNATFSHITGYSREQAIGESLCLFDGGHHSAGFYLQLLHNLGAQGHWQQEVRARNGNGKSFDCLLSFCAVRRDKDDRPAHFIGFLSDISMQKRQQSELEHIAHFDVLTGLPNRSLFSDRLNQAVRNANRRNQLIAIAFIDLDGFKEINDGYGHEVGDQLLREISTRMKEVCREGDTIARLGGDEFVALLIDLPNLQASEPLLKRLLLAASHPLKHGSEMLQVSGSIGVTFYPQMESVEADQLLRQADHSMYQAKLSGKNRIHMFDAEHDRDIRGLHESLENIRLALLREEFVLYYQPKVNMRTGEVVGAEALIRWQHPQRGMLYPGSFLADVDEHPLGLSLGEWVLATAIGQLAEWCSQGMTLRLSVNISAHHLQQEDFVQRLRHLLSRHPQADADRLELEVLETNALNDIERVSRIIQECALLGVSFALDDFGTGYSSLTYLKRLPAAVLKIDQSFVRDMLDDPEELAIIDGVLGLAKAFRREAIAEGVETLEHGRILLQLGCELAQGYAISRPVCAADLQLWISAWQPDPDWQQVQCMQLSEMPRLYAEVELRAWVKGMGDYLFGKRTQPPQMQPNQCRFGFWLEGAANAQANEWQKMAAIHLALHQRADEIQQMHLDGKTQEAIEYLPELTRLRDEILHLMA
jgi:diguanylate cyclase (GGDEF)-like protein/PAS domain S-box-containing protein